MIGLAARICLAHVVALTATDPAYENLDRWVEHGEVTSRCNPASRTSLEFHRTK